MLCNGDRSNLMSVVQVITYIEAHDAYFFRRCAGNKICSTPKSRCALVRSDCRKVHALLVARPRAEQRRRYAAGRDQVARAPPTPETSRRCYSSLYKPGTIENNLRSSHRKFVVFPMWIVVHGVEKLKRACL